MECERCGKIVSNKSNLISHLKIKKICNSEKSEISRENLLKKLQERVLGDKTYNCSLCKKPFNSSQGKYHHEKICKKIKDESVQVPNIVNNYNNCNNINPIYNVSIVINPVGLESKSYLTEESIKKLFLERPQGVFELLQLKHANEEIPQNHNIRKRVHKDNFLDTFNGKKWETKDYNVVFKEIFSNLGKDIMDFLNSNKDINFDDLSDDEEKRERLVHIFFDKIGFPLDWYVLFDTDALSQYKESYNIDWIDFEKKKKQLFIQAKETIYQFTKQQEKK